MKTVGVVASLLLFALGTRVACADERPPPPPPEEAEALQLQKLKEVQQKEAQKVKEAQMARQAQLAKEAQMAKDAQKAKDEALKAKAAAVVPPPTPAKPAVTPTPRPAPSTAVATSTPTPASATTPTAAPAAKAAASAVTPVAAPTPASPPAAVPVPVTASATLSNSVVRAVFAHEVTNREPANEISTLTRDVRKMYFFTEVRGLAGQNVVHAWEYNGQAAAVTTFEVKGPKWRMWSMRPVPPWVATVKVVVKNGAGDVIAEKTLK